MYNFFSHVILCVRVWYINGSTVIKIQVCYGECINLILLKHKKTKCFDIFFTY